MDVHHGQNQSMEHGEHLSAWRNANAASVCSQRPVAVPVEAVVHRPLIADQRAEPVDRTRFSASCGYAGHDLHTAVLRRRALARHADHLPDVSPCSIGDQGW
jgi:hypothetical protein